MDEQIVARAMDIIINAGDARLKCKDALTAVAAFDLEAARERMAEAETSITEAHRVQTDAIQGETRGEKAEYSLLFAHAQDTLMTINSEIVLTKQLLGVFDAYEQRLQALESAINA